MNNIIYPNKKIYVCGSVKSFESLESAINNFKNSIFIINGGACRGENFEEIEERINNLSSLMEKYSIFYNSGPEDLFYLKSLRDKLLFNSIYKWISKQNFITKIDFSNQTTILVIAGGINSINSEKNFGKSIEDLNLNIDTCLFEDSSWHNLYSGQLGFVVSSQPSLKDPQPSIYKYSCSIGYAHPSKSILQEINSQGLGESLIIG
jgi:hypothetical protein